MKPDTIEHPCPRCKQPSRSCGCTKAQVREYYEECRAIRRANHQQPAPKRGYHRVPESGPDVFPHEEGTPFALVKMGDKTVRIRTAEVPAVRSLPPEYDGDPPRGDAA